MLLMSRIRCIKTSVSMTLPSSSLTPKSTSGNSSQYNAPLPTPENSQYTSYTSLPIHTCPHIIATSLTLKSTVTATQPCSYQTDLTPNSSLLHPHCQVKDWLQSWHPFTSRTNLDNPIDLSKDDFKYLLSVINYSWASSTQETYSMGLHLTMCSVTHGKYWRSYSAPPIPC